MLARTDLLSSPGKICGFDVHSVRSFTAAGQPTGGWYPDEAISIQAALSAYTAGCAAACGESERLGKIATGFLGDFVVLLQDLFELDDPMRILETEAAATVVGGEVAFHV